MVAVGYPRLKWSEKSQSGHREHTNKICMDYGLYRQRLRIKRLLHTTQLTGGERTRVSADTLVRSPPVQLAPKIRTKPETIWRKHIVQPTGIGAHSPPPPFPTISITDTLFRNAVNMMGTFAQRIGKLKSCLYCLYIICLTQKLFLNKLMHTYDWCIVGLGAISCNVNLLMSH